MRWPPVPELLEDLREGPRRPTEVVGEALDRIRDVDPELGCFTCLNGGAVDRAEELEGEGPEGYPLYGLPVGVKDNQATRDLPTTYGSHLTADHRPDEDHPVVERLRAAGAVVVGKTNMAPFGLLALAVNDLHGPTRNPWDRERTPGGSSGGSAAAVAAGLVPAATGSDGGGSIRVPASFCGVFGHKPSRGRTPDDGAFPMFQDLSIPGVLTRTPEGTAPLLDVIAGPHPRDPDALPAPVPAYADSLASGSSGLEGVRVAYSPDLGGAPVESEVADLAREAVATLEADGAAVEEVDPDVPDEGEAMVTKTAVEALACFDERFPDWEEDLWAPLAAMAGGARDATAGEYVRARDAGDRLWSALEPVYRDHDLLATPATAVAPFGAGAVGVDDVAGEAVGPVGWMPFAFPFNFTGQPAASVPAGRTDEGLPVGLQLAGPPLGDRQVLAAAADYVEARGGPPETAPVGEAD
jgi:aspartyl-tRNA(Asn)/glutamyl-tRNA(Gln) amidotransferase subunit A